MHLTDRLAGADRNVGGARLAGADRNVGGAGAGFEPTPAYGDDLEVP
jgi:hypothetical protein